MLTLLPIDPFVFEELNPLKCKALDSCLWELTTLKNHYFYSVRDFIDKFEKPLIDMEHIPDYLNQNIQDVSLLSNITTTIIIIS